MCFKLDMETLLDIAVIVITIYSLTISIHFVKIHIFGVFVSIWDIRN